MGKALRVVGAVYSKSQSSDRAWVLQDLLVWQGSNIRCTFVEKGLRLGEEGLNSRDNPETEHTGLSD